MPNFRRESSASQDSKDRSRPAAYTRARRIEYILLINPTRSSLLQVRSTAAVLLGKSNRNNLEDAAARISRCTYLRGRLSAIFVDSHKSFIGTVQLLHASNSRKFYCSNLRSFCSKFFPSFTAHSKEFHEWNHIIYLRLLVAISNRLHDRANRRWWVES